MEFKNYKRKGLSEMTPWEEGFDMTNVSVSEADKSNGSPKAGDMIARNPKNHDDKWLVAKQYFDDNLELASTLNTSSDELTFGQATEAALEGKKIARKGWNGNGMFAYIVPANSYPAQTSVAKDYFGEGALVPYRAYWALKTAQEDIATWTPSGSDTLANDWVVI